MRSTSLPLVLLLASAMAAGAAEPAPRTLLVGTRQGLFQLQGDPAGDAAWRVTKLLPEERRPVRALAREAASGRLLAGSATEGGGALWLSGDRGATWRRLPGWPDSRQAWSVGFAGGGRLLAGSQPADIWTAASPDGEWARNESIHGIPERAEWSFIRAPYEAHIVTLAPDPRRPTRWLAAVERGGVLLSEDDGRTWRLCSPYWDVHVVAFLGERTFAAAAGEGLQVSTDAGATWRRLDAPSGYATGLCLDAAGTPFTVVKGATPGPLWQSTDAGRTWQPVAGSEGLPHPDYGVHALAPDPAVAGRVYFGVNDEVWMVSEGKARRLAGGLPPVLRLLVVP